MIATRPPGLTVTLAERRQAPNRLRTDVAALVGRTRRGPVLEPVRVRGWADFRRAFGGLVAGALTPYAARGYFENGGEAAHVVRVAGGDAAHGEWLVGADLAHRFGAAAYTLVAANPGTWANGATVTIRYLADGPAGTPEVDVRVRVRDETEERFMRVAPDAVVTALGGSGFVRLAPADPPAPSGPPAPPRSRSWTVTLRGGADAKSDETAYHAAVRALADADEPALLALPDLHPDLGSGSDDAAARAVTAGLLEEIAPMRDRLLVLDAPREVSAAAAAIAWAVTWPQRTDPALLRNSALYHPWLRVPDPLGGAAEPLRDVPPSGHLAGVISRLDRERGAGHSPANALIRDAVDLVEAFGERDQAALYQESVNPLRCAAGGGLEVWGARTLDPGPEWRFVAHRRLLHRLVRAIRQVAEPLVFEPQGPELRLTLVRQITSVLLEAYAGGSLRGDRPEDAFTVQCDDANNPPDQVELGRLVCDISLAPAAPMEQIHIRLSLAPGGLLEVIEQ
jgi:phage tail sheath protein FI